MKALLVESKDLKKRNYCSAIILLPSGKIELGLGDPASIIIELDDDNLSVRILSAYDFASFRVVKEVEITGRFYFTESLKSLAAEDFSRAALFFLMTPVLAALSMAL